MAIESFEQLEARAHEDCELAPDMSVAEYFRGAFGADLDDICHAREDGETSAMLTGEDGLGMSLRTPCGVMCMHAIDRAAAFLPFAENAGSDVDMIALARDAVMVLIFG